MCPDRAPALQLASPPALGLAAALFATAGCGRASLDVTTDQGNDAEAGGEAPDTMLSEPEAQADGPAAPDAGEPTADGGDGGPDVGSGPDAEADAQDSGLSIVGNGTVLPGSVSFYPSSALYLFPLTVPAPATLVDLATIAQSSQGDAGTIQLGLYDQDDAGNPTSLLASTPVFAVVPGDNRVVAHPAGVVLAGGRTYWVALLALTGGYTIELYQYPVLAGTTTDWIAQETTLPAMFPAATSSFNPAPELNFFILVQY